MLVKDDEFFKDFRRLADNANFAVEEARDSRRWSTCSPISFPVKP